MLCKDCNIEAAAVTYHFFYVTLRGIFTYTLSYLYVQKMCVTLRANPLSDIYNFDRAVSQGVRAFNLNSRAG